MSVENYLKNKLRTVYPQPIGHAVVFSVLRKLLSDTKVTNLQTDYVHIFSLVIKSSQPQAERKVMLFALSRLYKQLNVPEASRKFSVACKKMKVTLRDILQWLVDTFFPGDTLMNKALEVHFKTLKHKTLFNATDSILPTIENDHLLLLLYMTVADTLRMNSSYDKLVAGYKDIDGNIALPLSRYYLSLLYHDNKTSFKKTFSTVNAFLNRNGDLLLHRDSAQLFKKVKESTVSKETKRKVLYNLALLLLILKERKMHAKYMAEYRRLKSSIIRDRKANIIRKPEKEGCLQVSVLKERKKAIDMDDLTPHALIFNLLIYIDPTPRLEYRSLIFSPTSDLDKKNYLSKIRGTWTIVLNNYKTVKYYKRWTIVIKSDRLQRYINKYVKTNKLSANDHIFLNAVGKEYPHNKFSEFIKRAFFNKTGIDVTINCLRKIKEVELFHRNPMTLTMSLKEKEDFVKNNFRHSLRTSMLYYNRIDKDVGAPLVAPDRDNQTIFEFSKDLETLMGRYGITKTQLGAMFNRSF